MSVLATFMKMNVVLQHFVMTTNIYSVAHSSVVIKAVCYKPEGRGFEAQ
jgi:hypothetical protein